MTPIIGFHTTLLSAGMRADFSARLRNFNDQVKIAGSAKCGPMANLHRRSVWLLFLLLTLSLRCYSAEVVLLRSSGSASPEQHELELATQFYGLDLKVVTVGAKEPVLMFESIQPTTTVAVAIEADALANVNRKALFQILRRGHDGSLPLLIIGVTAETDGALLREWSGVAAISSKPLDSSSGLQYVVGDKSNITQQLTGFEFPFPGNRTFYFHLEENSNAQVIMAVRKNHQLAPVFIEQNLNGQAVFLLSKTLLSNDDIDHQIFNSTEDAFEKIAPAIVFIKYCAGERGWHTAHHYANLTIDDPWLREPYGNLSYEGLLKEMERHNFHTTIAFIPWNYDRSEAEVVSLFQRNPDRFSICIHGDNHAHKEFTDYVSKPLDAQVFALRQAVARMEMFQARSGIPYDRVMVFPHSIAPEQTLEALKANDYLATINSQNVPMGSVSHAGLLSAMRPTTLSFGGFPSILRYPAVETIPSYRIAIENFLDNPLFYYTHQDFFANGIDAFDGLADEVNKIEPDTRWRGVGDIVKHLYLLRLRGDSNYDVLAQSGSLLLDNTSGRSLIFYVKRIESGSPRVTSVSVDGRPLPFQLHDGFLDVPVPVAAGETRSLVIRYQDAQDLASVNTSKSSLYVYVLRYISDFRDITLSRVQVGRKFTALYYANRLKAELLIVGGFGLIVFCIFGGWRLAVTMRREALSK